MTAHPYTAIIEGQSVILLVDDHCNLTEGVLSDSIGRGNGLVVDHCLQFEVGSQPQLQFLAVCAM